jgi:hypothetical protein
MQHLPAQTQRRWKALSPYNDIPMIDMRMNTNEMSASTVSIGSKAELSAWKMISRSENNDSCDTGLSNRKSLHTIVFPFRGSSDNNTDKEAKATIPTFPLSVHRKIRRSVSKVHAIKTISALRTSVLVTRSPSQ